MPDGLAEYRGDDATGRPPQQLAGKAAANAVAHIKELANTEMIHQPELVVGERVPRVLNRDRARRLAAIGISLVHRDAAEVVLERLRRVEDRGWPVADPRIQATAGGDQKREAGAGLLVADTNVTLLVKRHSSAPCSVMSADGVEHDHRDLALGLLLVIGVRRPELQCLLPQPGALLAGGSPGPCLELLCADLHVDLGVGEKVAIPPRVLRRTAFRSDHDIAVAG